MSQNTTEKIGESHISDDVLNTIAGLAATEVKGVYALEGDLKHDMITYSGVKNLTKGVRVTEENGKVTVRVSLILDGTAPIPDVYDETQKKVKNAIESMTGKTVDEIKVTIQGVNI